MSDDLSPAVHLAEERILRRPQVMDSPKDALARIKRAFAGPLIDRDLHGRERRRAELLYTCEICVNGPVVARAQGRRLSMSCPSTRAGNRLSPFPFSALV